MRPTTIISLAFSLMCASYTIVLAQNAGRYDSDVAVAQEALKAAELNAGLHPDVLVNSLNNLAMLYKSHADYAKAEPLYKRSLAILEEKLGPDHPDVAKSLMNIATLYRGQRDYAKAEALFKRSLVIFEKVLGPDHPSVATCLENLAALYRATMRNTDAELLEIRSTKIRSISK